MSHVPCPGERGREAHESFSPLAIAISVISRDGGHVLYDSSVRQAIDLGSGSDSGEEDSFPAAASGEQREYFVTAYGSHTNATPQN